MRFPPNGTESSRSRGAPGVPQRQWGDPGACAPLGGTVLGVVLGFVRAPGQAPHSWELQPGGRSALEEGDALQPRGKTPAHLVGSQPRWEGAGC